MLDGLPDQRSHAAIRAVPKLWDEPTGSRTGAFRIPDGTCAARARASDGGHPCLSGPVAVIAHSILAQQRGPNPSTARSAPST